MRIAPIRSKVIITFMAVYFAIKTMMLMFLCTLYSEKNLFCHKKFNILYDHHYYVPLLSDT